MSSGGKYKHVRPKYPRKALILPLLLQRVDQQIGESAKAIRLGAVVLFSHGEPVLA